MVTSANILDNIDNDIEIDWKSKRYDEVEILKYKLNPYGNDYTDLDELPKYYSKDDSDRNRIEDDDDDDDDVNAYSDKNMRRKIEISFGSRKMYNPLLGNGTRACFSRCRYNTDCKSRFCSNCFKFLGRCVRFW